MTIDEGLVSNLPLPQWVRTAYASKGLKQLYPWQSECLNIPGVLTADAGQLCNLVYSAPTSGGKTLVSELVLLKRLCEISTHSFRLALFVLPYVSVVAEKERYLSLLCKRSNGSIKVHGFYGGSHLPLSILTRPGEATLAVCTIEKANAIVSFLLESGSLGNLVACVIDEVHLLGDNHRGYLLEIAIAKIRRFSLNCQIVAMSATLPNQASLACWLSARNFSCDFRPVPLDEMVAFDRKIVSVRTGQKVRDAEPLPWMDDRDGFLGLTFEVLREGHSVLVFCSSKQKCETCAESVAAALQSNPENVDESEKVRQDRIRLVAELRLTPGGLDGVLARTVPFGIAYHHSGLTVEERTLIEAAYRSGSINCLTATSTLAAGVNLPARRVIFRSPFIAAEFIDAARYRQMAGRAGRAGQGVSGESIVICGSAKEGDRMMEIARRAILPPLTSALGQGGLQRLLLEVMSAVGRLSGDAIVELDNATFLRWSLNENTKKKKELLDVISAEERVKDEDHLKKFETEPPECLSEAMSKLLAKQLIALEPSTGEYFSTPFGRAVSGSGLECSTGDSVYRELCTVRENGLNVESDLHLCYLLVSAAGSESLPIQWTAYLKAVESLGQAERRTISLIGVRPGLIQRASLQNSMPGPLKNTPEAKIVMRFFSALLLWLMVNMEISVATLSARFLIPRGSLQSLRTSAGAFAGAVASFCSKMRWASLESIIDDFARRVLLGVGQQVELAPLMQINGMTRSFAQELFSQGIGSPGLVARLSASDFAQIVRKALPSSLPFLPIETAFKFVSEAKRLTRQIRKQERATDLSKAGASSALTVSRGTTTLISVSSDNPQTPEKVSKKRKLIDTEFSAPLFSGISRTGSPAIPEENNDLPNPPEYIKRYSEIPSQPSSVSTLLAEGLRGMGRASLSSQETAKTYKFPGSQESRVSLGSSSSLIGPKLQLMIGNPKIPEIPNLVGKFRVLKEIPSSVKIIAVTGYFGANQNFEFFCVYAPFCGTVLNALSLSGIMVDPSVLVISADIKTLSLRILATVSDFFPRCSLIDTTLGRYLLDPDMEISTHQLLTSEQGKELKELPEKFQPAARCYSETEALLIRLRSLGLLNYFSQIEVPLAVVIASMEAKGILVRPWERSQRGLIAKMDALEREVNRIVGRDVQLTCPEDVSRALFEDLLLPIPSKKKVDTNDEESQLSLGGIDSLSLIDPGTPITSIDVRTPETKRRRHLSTKKDVLKSINHPVASYVEEHRKLTIALSHSISVSHAVGPDSRVHCRFSQLSSATGRLAATHPPMLNMEVSFEVSDVKRKTLQDDSENVQLHQKVYIANVRYAPPRARRIAEAELIALLDVSANSPISVNELTDSTPPCGPMVTLADYWSTCGWKCYEEKQYASEIRQCHVKLLDGSILTFPADQVWRVEQPLLIDSSDEAPKMKICLREMFIAGCGRSLISVDYAQIEVRLLAHFSKDPNMCAIINTPGVDIFNKIASSWLGRSSVTSEERNGCKKIVYGLLYGMGARKMSHDLGVDEQQAEELVNKFFDSFPFVKPWIDITIANAKSCGYIESIGGRRRYLHGFSGNQRERSKAERQAINSLCQSSAADLIKVAMVRIQSRFLHMVDAKPNIVLQIHDELLVECESDYVEQVKSVIVSEMTRNVLDVSLEVKWAVGPSWGELCDATVQDR